MRTASRALLTGIVLVFVLVPLQQAAGSTSRKGPSTPTNLRVTATSTSSVSVAWQVAKNKGWSQPAGYDLYRDHVRIGNTSSTAFTFSSLSCGTAYVFGVDAFDAAGNRSQVMELTAGTSQCPAPPPAPPTPDTSPPSTPAGLTVSGSTGSTISLVWDSSTDNVGVAGYGVYRQGSFLQSTTATNYTFGALACGTSYALGVDAFDAAGNRSGVATVTASTAACPDTSPPTMPMILTPIGATSTSISFSWISSFDDVGVAGYGIYRNGVRVDTTTATNYTMTGLSCGTSYLIGVDAFDAAGNRSLQTTITMATSGCQSLAQSIADGSTIAGAVSWSASASSGGASKVDFYIDGTLKWTDSAAPYYYNGDGDALDTTKLPDGGHTFKVVVVYSDGTSASNTATATVANAFVAPPPKGGYFSLQPVGSWSSLPGDSACAQMVHRSPWEPRPDNYKRNHDMPDAAAVHAAFAARPLAVDNNYDSRWDTWLLPRVDGQFTGTTDEIFQWAACKWGLSDDMLRAIAVRESTWYEYLTYPSGRCVTNWGCGDMISTPTADTTTYCNMLAKYGYDYQQDYGAGICPKTFSIVGVMSWEAPSWGVMPDNQNGTFPFNRNSTAFAVDYLGAHLRGCYEGWIHWLANGGTGTYAAGDIWGCVGSWYSGDWHSSAADGYISRVQNELANFTWLQPGWASDKPSCSSTYGCPGPDPYPY